MGDDGTYRDCVQFRQLALLRGIIFGLEVVRDKCDGRWASAVLHGPLVLPAGAVATAFSLPFDRGESLDCSAARIEIIRDTP